MHVEESEILCMRVSSSNIHSVCHGYDGNGVRTAGSNRGRMAWEFL